MKNDNIMKDEYLERLKTVLDQSWEIFKLQFIHKRHEINTEAPFQHHFAQIIRNVGNLYSVYEKDLFKVDLEKKYDIKNGKSKYIDITCEFVDIMKCAIELKFKTKEQGAIPNNRYLIYTDINRLENLTTKQFDIGKFYMITDECKYSNELAKGVSEDFSIRHEYYSKANKDLQYKSSIDRKPPINLRNIYYFKWEEIDGWYFLEITVLQENKPSYNVKEIRKEHKQAYEPWTAEDDAKLEMLFYEGLSVKGLCEIFERQEGAIRSRLRKLELR